MTIEEKRTIAMSPVDKPGGGEEIKFEPLTLQQTLENFDKYKTQQSYPAFVELVTELFQSSSPLRAFKKDKNLPVLILRLLSDGRDPIVDKRSRTVFDPLKHGAIRAGLYVLYKNIPVASAQEISDKSHIFTRPYREEGFGYYWSSARRQSGMELRPLPMGHETYKPDRIDKDTWQMVVRSGTKTSSRREE